MILLQRTESVVREGALEGRLGLPALCTLAAARASAAGHVRATR